MDIKVVGTGVIKQALLAIKPLFERASGETLALSFNTTGVVADRISRGEAVDVVVTSRESIDELVRQGHVRADGTAEIARSGIGAVVKSGAPKPDISTSQGLKAVLLAARRVAYTNPTSGGASGVAVARLLDRLGISGEIGAKARLGEGGSIAQMVAQGEADFGLHQVSLIVGQPGVDYVGPLPREFQHYTFAVAGVPRNAAAPEGAGRLIAFLKSPEAVAIMRAQGMD